MRPIGKHPSFKDLQGNSYEPFKCQPHKKVKHTQWIRRLLPTNSLSVFDHFLGSVYKELNPEASASIPWTRDVNWTYIGRSERLIYFQFISCIQGGGVCKNRYFKDFWKYLGRWDSYGSPRSVFETLSKI